MNEIEQLKQRVQFLENLLFQFVGSGEYTVQKPLRFFEGRNIQAGTITGTMIGSSSSEKLGFYGHQPVIRQSSITAPSGGATVDAQARTAVSSVITTLQTLGLTA